MDVGEMGEGEHGAQLRIERVAERLGQSALKSTPAMAGIAALEAGSAEC
jgi:hypothetical protein